MWELVKCFTEVSGHDVRGMTSGLVDAQCSRASSKYEIHDPLDEIHVAQNKSNGWPVGDFSVGS